MRITLAILRSEEWLRAERLRTGDNVPEKASIQYEVDELPEKARGILLAYGRGKYLDAAQGLFFGTDYNLNVGASYGSVPLRFDGYAPTPEEIGQAIMQAAAELGKRKSEYAARYARLQEEKAEQDEESKKRSEAEVAARRVLRPKLEALKSERDGLQADKDVLIDFLAHVPEDAKRGALHALAAAKEEAAIATIRDEIDAAGGWELATDV